MYRSQRHPDVKVFAVVVRLGGSGWAVASHCSRTRFTSRFSMHQLRFWMRVIALIGATATATAAQAQPVAADSARAHARLTLELSEFHAAWQRFWRTSEIARAVFDKDKIATRLRLGYVHCHPDRRTGTVAARAEAVVLSADVAVRPYALYPLIQSDSSIFATCPTWMMSQAVPLALDESLMLDGALLPDYRDAARFLRVAVLSAFDSAARQWPGDGWIAGQRTRLRVDQRDTVGAQQAVDSCAVTGWWCAALRGYVASWRGRTVVAESLFRAMQQQMSPAQRCAWNNEQPLLSRDERDDYDHLSCDARSTMSTTMWWLADPLFRVAGNERYVTQESRRVQVAMRRAVGSDERFAWDGARGGDAMARLIERYGWPTYTSWGGPAVDDAHAGYLTLRGSTSVEPFTTFEYTNDREHFVPSARARNNPFAAEESDWSLFGEPTESDPLATMWPAEHVRVMRPIAQLRDGQTVMLRRQSHVVAVTAVNTSSVVHPQNAARRDSVPLAFDAMLLRTTSPTHIDSLAQRTVRAGNAIVMQGMIPSAPALLAIEALGLGGLRVDARTRFGIVPPPSLSTMRAADVAISDAALIDVRRGSFDAQTPADTILDHLLGSVQLDSTTRRVGLYWETYGIAAGDTVAIAVRVSRDDDVSLARRLGVALNVASDPNRPIEIRWTEPDPQHATRTLVGPVPVQQRFLVLNLGQLIAGTYALEISVERRGAPLVRTRRTLVFEP